MLSFEINYALENTLSILLSVINLLLTKIQSKVLYVIKELLTIAGQKRAMQFDFMSMFAEARKTAMERSEPVLGYNFTDAHNCENDLSNVVNVNVVAHLYSAAA